MVEIKPLATFDLKVGQDRAKPTRANIVNHVQSNAPPGMAAARVTFTEETAVFLGGKEVRARYFGRGHTNGDAVVFFPARRTIHTGDLMAGTSILCDYGNGGSAKEWIFYESWIRG